ncbi:MULTISPECIES: hypothetical protein [Mycobacteriaceae]|uniref:hypothetical protein n=1 Tax=Mycobacteriaceae TaxID=1762 RepID=UPI0007FFB7A0|nr:MULTISPECIES: hypothetical protein [Mycobacteriaceae]MCK0177265.1 hypothetical protein [Mycolicibacterium sp. F2034L]OBB62199.1 hypothetical protein A5757_04805 [Mycobacterium sp. 852013-51886_SCH5428379]
MTNDVEKRWHDPEAFRAAVGYVVAFVALAGVALGFFVIPGDHPLIPAILVPVILFAGGLGAFIRTYRVWRAGGTWVIWQGAGWFLFALFLLGLSVPGAALTA